MRHGDRRPTVVEAEERAGMQRPLFVMVVDVVGVFRVLAFFFGLIDLLPGPESDLTGVSISST